MATQPSTRPADGQSLLLRVVGAALLAAFGAPLIALATTDITAYVNGWRPSHFPVWMLYARSLLVAAVGWTTVFGALVGLAMTVRR